MPPEIHYDLAKLDPNNIVADRAAINEVLPQRFELEQLDAIIFIDTKTHIVAGVKNVRPNEFWVRGHMPNYPLLPGVLLCEASAQLCAYYVATAGILTTGDFLGFGGMENVRFRGPVHPGDRLILVGKPVKMHRRQCVFNVQGFVGDTMVFHGDIIGVPMHKKAEG